MKPADRDEFDWLSGLLASCPIVALGKRLEDLQTFGTPIQVTKIAFIEHF
jgi:hypothetical protein